MAAIILTISAVLAILAGLMVLFWPKIFRIALGIYLLLIGVLKLVELNLV